MSLGEYRMSPNSLPTPAPSTEILPDKKGSLSDGLFALPPAAILGHTSVSPSIATPSPNTSDSSYHPLSPPSNNRAKAPNGTKRRTSSNEGQAVASQATYELPPPPTRSRKIIQMKPRGQSNAQEHPPLAPAKTPQSPAGPASIAPATIAKTSPSTTGSKRKQGGANTTAASRKIARKTAHSLIERRRRSKMNEEFGVLKDMIPACRGQEMHKLAILQASIEYMRYLEQCLTDLKSAHGSHALHTRPPPALAQSGQETPTAAAFQQRDEEEESDEEMTDAEATSPRSMRPQSVAGSSVRSHQPSISPAIIPSAQTSPELMSKPGSRYGYGSYGSYSHSHSHSRNSSALPSPAFEPQTQAAGPKYATFAPLTSPALGPQGENTKDLEKDDHEATAALLMLNTDRRSWSGPTNAAKGVRGMSVKDLLG